MTDIGVRPLYDSIVIETIEDEKQTSTGLHLPDTSKVTDTVEKGRVLMTGPGPITNSGRYVGADVSEGDRIIFEKFAGTDMVVDGEEIRILPQEKILAIIEEVETDDG